MALIAHASRSIKSWIKTNAQPTPLAISISYCSGSKKRSPVFLSLPGASWGALSFLRVRRESYVPLHIKLGSGHGEKWWWWWCYWGFSMLFSSPARCCWHIFWRFRWKWDVLLTRWQSFPSECTISFIPTSKPSPLQTFTLLSCLHTTIVTQWIVADYFLYFLLEVVPVQQQNIHL